MGDDHPTRCGTVALAGRPNVGKSALLNALVGAKLAITGHRPQTTRQAVVGIRTDARAQLVFIDPPGLLHAQYLLQDSMMAAAAEAIRGADAVLYLHPAADGPPPDLRSLVSDDALRDQPIATVLSKADTVPLDALPAAVPPTFLVSATTGQGLEPLLEWCRARVPEGPYRYPPDDISVQPMRFFAAEFVREAAFEILHDELPYAVAAQVDEFREGSEPVYIRVTVFVERASQKGMVIGSGGRTIKALGRLARAHLETLLGQRVYLDLWVKVLPRWRKAPHLLSQLGFRLPSTRNS